MAFKESPETYSLYVLCGISEKRKTENECKIIVNTAIRPFRMTIYSQISNQKN